MSQFVSNYRHEINIQGGAFVEEESKAMRGCSGMFHRAGIYLNHRLGILVVGILDASIFREETDHLRRFTHIQARIIFAIRAHVVGNGYGFIGVFDDCEFAYDQRNKVHSMRDIVSPMMCSGSSMISDAEQVAIGDGDKLGGNGRDNFGCGTVVGCIMTGKPVAVVTRLTKCPGLYGTGRILWFWFHEVQTCARSGMILDCDGEFLSIFVSTIERHDEFFLADAVRQLFAML